MEDPVIAQIGPYAVEVGPGDKVVWCRCGRSANQPLCDGSHNQGSELRPLLFTAEKAETLYFCGCKHTNTPPFCDGTHNLP
jgi:CDGSH-type Zn-finger protein